MMTSWRKLRVEYFDEDGWVPEREGPWTRYLLRRFKTYGMLGPTLRIRYGRRRVADAAQVDFDGLDDTLSEDAPEVERIIKANAALIKKAVLVAKDLEGAGTLNPAQADLFFRFIFTPGPGGKKRAG